MLTATLQGQTFAERLGWSPQQVVVILHVDDVGMSHSSNLGAIQAIEQGVANSWAVMMPCPWVSEIAQYLKEHPQVDSGLHHLDLGMETLPLGSPGRKTQVRSGGLRRLFVVQRTQVLASASADEIEIEIRAQIDRARAWACPSPTLTVIWEPSLPIRTILSVMRRWASNKIPILVAGGHLTHARKENGEAVERLKPWVEKIWDAGLPVIDDLHTASYSWPANEKPQRLRNLLKSLRPGITEILFHASEPSDIFPLITGSSASRKGDLEALVSNQVRQTLTSEGIVLTTWKELARRRKEVKP